jgi:hypothetical protein
MNQTSRENDGALAAGITLNGGPETAGGAVRAGSRPLCSGAVAQIHRAVAEAALA